MAEEASSIVTSLAFIFMLMDSSEMFWRDSKSLATSCAEYSIGLLPSPQAPKLKLNPIKMTHFRIFIQFSEPLLSRSLENPQSPQNLKEYQLFKSVFKVIRDLAYVLLAFYMKQMSKVSKDQAEAAISQMLLYIGENPDREGLKKTPHRVAKAFLELTEGYQQDPREILSTTFSESYNDMVVVRDIEFWSLCEHHLLPFHGRATVGYIPKDRVVGLSKIGRLVQCFSRRLQVQEKMTQQIAYSMMEHLNPQGVGVIVKASHQCMAMRGVKAPAEMVTSCLLGQFLDPTTRNEFLSFR